MNRAPVLTLWAAVVAERLGHAWPDALTLGKSLAGLNAQSKGRALGIYKGSRPKPTGEREERGQRGEVEFVTLFHRHVPVERRKGGVRALERGKPIDPDAVERYLQAKLKEAYEPARRAMRLLARSRPKQRLAEEGFALYEAFRPTIPSGKRGWGAAGALRLDRLRELAREK